MKQVKSKLVKFPILNLKKKLPKSSQITKRSPFMVLHKLGFIISQMSENVNSVIFQRKSPTLNFSRIYGNSLWNTQRSPLMVLNKPAFIIISMPQNWNYPTIFDGILPDWNSTNVKQLMAYMTKYIWQSVNLSLLQISMAENQNCLTTFHEYPMLNWK